MVYFGNISIFGDSVVALILILAMHGLFSAIHVWQEWKGSEVPLWRVFGAIVGARVPDPLGFTFFTIGLLVALWTVGLAGIAGWLPFVGPLSFSSGSMALGLILGALVGDTILSHWVLYGLGYRPNPGLSSTALYTAEAGFLTVTFWNGLSNTPVSVWIGFAIGVGAFASVLPLVSALRFAPGLKRERWVRWQPIPAWARL